MAELSVRLLGDGECLVDHPASGAALHTSRSARFGGRGSSFSSTDLVAAALATCVATDLEHVAVRNGVSLDRIRIEAGKELLLDPKRLAALHVRVRIAGACDDVTLLKLRRAADACVVQRALHPDVECMIEIVRDDPA